MQHLQRDGVLVAVLHLVGAARLALGLELALALQDKGNTVIVIEHNLQMMRAADYIIDIGPGPGEMGGRVVAVGTPEEVARNIDSVTGPYLAEELARVATESDD